jgi:predicted GIY-YIG superfamily endonuclease
MAKTPRDTVTYDLKRAAKIVYRGTTNDPERREQQHRDEGKRFTHMTVTSRRMTKDGAEKKEADALESYRRSHGGKNPPYNANDEG